MYAKGYRSLTADLIFRTARNLNKIGRLLSEQKFLFLITENMILVKKI